MHSLENLTFGQFSFVYNSLSFAIAALGAATIFLFLSRSQVSINYKSAVTISGLVCLIAAYHYYRIFNSWEAAYSVANGVVSKTGQPFNDAYRYVDWILTVPLLVTELILVMRLPGTESGSKATRLAVLAVIMVALGYPGEISNSAGTRWVFWALAMIPFAIIVFDLFVGLKDAIGRQPDDARGLVSAARWILVLTWCFYPVVFVLPMLGLSGPGATVGIQVGYSLADILAKAGFGVFIYMIAARKSRAEAPQDLRNLDYQSAGAVAR